MRLPDAPWPVIFWIPSISAPNKFTFAEIILGKETFCTGPTTYESAGESSYLGRYISNGATAWARMRNEGARSAPAITRGIVRR
jgi:hypothetical protein